MCYDSLDQRFLCIRHNTDVIAVIESANLLIPDVQCVVPAITNRAHVWLRYGLDLPPSTARYLGLEPHNSRYSEVTRIGLQLYEVLAI